MKWGASAGSEQWRESPHPKDGEHEDHSPHPNLSKTLTPQARQSQTQCLQTFRQRQNQPKEGELLCVYILSCCYLHIHNRMISVTSNGAVALKDKLA